jgi:ribonuclease P protein component
LKRSFRLSSTLDFQRVRRKGQSYAHPLLILITHPNQREDVRVGVIAGKRVGNAVERNRAKRLLRVAAQALIPQIIPGYDLILIARPPILKIKSPVVITALKQKLKQAGLLANNAN